MQKLILTLTLVFAATCGVQAETIVMDPVVVTATRTETPLSQVGSSVTVITAEEIEQKGETQVLEVLRSVPGVTIIQSGPIGSTTSIRLRGTEDRHTLVMIDGIEFRDASNTGGQANLANLTTDNIERIEIVRGAQSVLYGSDAIGGVVNIITKKGSRQPHAYASVEGGSYNTWREAAGFSSGTEKARVSMAFSRTDSDGFSALSDDNEDDGYENTTISLNIGADLTDFFTLNLDFRATDSKYDYDTYSYGVYSDYTQDTKDLSGRTEGVFTLLNGRWISVFGASVTDSDRAISGAYSYKYTGKITKFDLKNTILLNKNQTLMVGIETEKEEFEGDYSEYAARNKAAYIQDQITFGQFSTALGVRVDDHQKFGTETTWRLAPSYTLATTETKIKGSAATGFKAPSLYQIYYNSTYGIEDLDPETSMSFDIGLEQPLLGNSLIVGITWFYNDIDNYIAWDDDGDFDYFDGEDGYFNIDTLKTQGIESMIDWYPCEYAKFKLGYTYTDTKNQEGARSARIPLHQGAIDVNIYPRDDVQLNITLLYVGKREDGATDKSLDDYTLVNLAASWQVVEHITIFGRIDNLLDEDYEEASGYGTAGASGYLGLKASF